MTSPLPLANLITLGARDFGALGDFYRRVGWPQVMDDGDFAVFELRGIVLALFPLSKLARWEHRARAEQRWHPLHHWRAGRQCRGGGPAHRAHACGRCSGDEGTCRRGVLHRSFGLPVRPRGQLLRDRLGRHAQQSRRHRSSPSRRSVTATRCLCSDRSRYRPAAAEVAAHGWLGGLLGPLRSCGDENALVPLSALAQPMYVRLCWVSEPPSGPHGYTQCAGRARLNPGRGRSSGSLA